MIRLAAIRSRLGARGRTLLGVLALAWINATMQPCLMAMEMPPVEQPPAAVSQGHAQHGSQASGHGEHVERVCAHCPPAMSHDGNSCSLADLDGCDRLPEAKPGERILKIDIDDGAVFMASHIYFVDVHYASAVQAFVRPHSLQPTFQVGPSLSIRHCVFLK